MATVHFNADRSPYYKDLVAAEKRAKEFRLGLWKSFVDEDVETEKQKQANDTAERKLNLKKVRKGVIITRFSLTLSFIF